MVVALTVLALGGAGTASATELCSTNTDPCSGTKYESGTTVEAELAEGTEAVLATSLGTVSCAKATLEGETTSAGGEEEVVDGTLSNVSFGECETSGGMSCTMSAQNLPYELEFAPATEGDGILFVADESALSTSVVCSLGVSCTLVPEEEHLRFLLDGGNPATFDAEEIPFETTGGFFCPEEASFTAQFQLPAPTPVTTQGPWMRSNPTEYNFGKVKLNVPQTQKITFRYIGGRDSRLLSAFVSNTEGNDFTVAIKNGKPDEDCKDKKVVQGTECFAVIQFKPEKTGARQAKVAVDENTSISPRPFDMVVKGEGVP